LFNALNPDMIVLFGHAVQFLVLYSRTLPKQLNSEQIEFVFVTEAILGTVV